MFFREQLRSFFISPKQPLPEVGLPEGCLVFDTQQFGGRIWASLAPSHTPEKIKTLIFHAILTKIQLWAESYRYPCQHLDAILERGSSGICRGAFASSERHSASRGTYRGLFAGEHL